jgi:tellurite resistance protein TerC
MIWIIFLLLIFGLLALDLGVFHKSNEAVSLKESLTWTTIWVTAALFFGGVVYWVYDTNFLGINPGFKIDPTTSMIDYYTGYVIEESLSLDNIFVMAMIFKFFKIEPKFQHKVLFWGIIGAVFFRFVMISLGTSFIHNFSWSTYIFGGILVYSALTMIRRTDEADDFKKSIGVRLLSKLYRIDWELRDGRYLVKQNGKWVATSLMAALVVVEFSDIIFAVDSIPAIFSITTDSFIVFTSNIFAILGLRSLYFFLANMIDKFQYMKYALVLVLLFVGIKMLLFHFIEIPPLLSLGIILGLLISGVLFSKIKSAK